jgi:hypothetical protein
MKDLKKKALKVLMIVSFLLASIFITVFAVNRIKELLDKPVPVIVDNEKELRAIDSLTNVINMQDELIQQLKDSVVVVEKIVIKEVEKIKELPITENVDLLKENLVQYGEMSTEDDPYPTLIEIDDDTVAILSENNIIDANIIAAKYEGELNKNSILNEIVYNDSITISLKNEILYNKDAIINNQEEAYNTMKNNLEVALKKEKREKTYWTIGGAVITSLLTGYIIYYSKR